MNRIGARSGTIFGPSLAIGLVVGVCVPGLAQSNTQKDAWFGKLNKSTPAANLASPSTPAGKLRGKICGWAAESPGRRPRSNLGGVGKRRLRLQGSSKRQWLARGKLTTGVGGGVHATGGRGAQPQRALGAGDAPLWIRRCPAFGKGGRSPGERQPRRVPT